jgi:hypothetical protein
MVDNKTCYMGGNFNKATNSAALFGYDYDSVMHYGPTTFIKGGLPAGSQTITAVVAAPTMGQRNHLSANDVAGIRASYPKFINLASVVVTPGLPAVVCELLGREADAATTYQRDGAALFTFTGNRRTFSSFVGVQLQSQSCNARSNFWLGSYPYPNTDPSKFGAESAAGDETFAAPSSTVAFIDASLIPSFIQ